MLGASEGAGADHLWAKAAELEREFAGYKRRLAERRAHAVAEVAGRAGGGEDDEEERAGDAAAGRGRRYEQYVRRRDERLRQEWRARMERKEAEVQALWARLDRTGSRGRRGGGDDGELAAAASGAHAREDQVKPQQKPGNLVVKVKPSTPVTPRGNPGHPAAKLARPRTSAPSSSMAAASPRLSTPDPRRRPSHLHREQPQAEPRPPATPRKENRLPPPLPSTALAAASPATTPRPRTAMLSRSRSMFKDRGSSSVAAARESPRPPRLLPPRSSYDSASNLKEPTPSPRADARAAVVMQSSSCSTDEAVIADRKKASAVTPEPFPVRRSCNGVEITPAGGGNADNKSNQEHVPQSSDKFGSVEITGDSDTEPSYVYIKKDSHEQIPRPPPASPGLGTCPGPEPRSDEEDGDNVDDTMESTGSNEVAAGETAAADAEEEFRRESSESLYSNVQSSFSPRSELDTSATDSPVPSATEQSPESNTSPSPWTTRKSTEMEDAEKRLPIPITPRSSATVSMGVQSPMDAVNGLKRLLTFGKRNGKTSEAAAAAAAEQRAPRPVTPAPPTGDDSSVTGECPAAGGSAVKQRLDSSDVAASDDLDSSYVISPHVRSLQSVGPSYAYPASSELMEPALHAKSPRVHRPFFSFSSFKSRVN